MKILISHATVYTANEKREVIEDGYVLTDGTKIAYAGGERPVDAADREIDAQGKILMPGFVNAHTHLPMTLLRGYGGGVNLQTWLNEYIFPAEDKLDAEAVRIGTQLALAEAIACGTTSVSDMYFFCDAIIAAVIESGISANIARGVTLFDPDADPATYPSCVEMDELRRKWHGYNDGQILIDACIHGEYTSSANLWGYMAEYAKKHGLRMHVHLSETKEEHEKCIARHGMTPTAVLDKYGVWDVPATAAHGVWTTPGDWDILGDKGVTVVHNPVSNMKLASGAAPVERMLSEGINVALGTDGMSSNNSHDMFEEMKFASLLAKVTEGDAQALSPHRVLRMATGNGAQAQGRCSGVIEAGAVADLILVECHAPNMMPCHSVADNLVYSAHGSNVSMNMSRGCVIYENGTYLTLDIEKIYREVEERAVPKLFR